VRARARVGSSLLSRWLCHVCGAHVESTVESTLDAVCAACMAVPLLSLLPAVPVRMHPCALHCLTRVATNAPAAGVTCSCSTGCRCRARRPAQTATAQLPCQTPSVRLCPPGTSGGRAAPSRAQAPTPQSRRWTAPPAAPAGRRARASAARWTPVGAHACVCVCVRVCGGRGVQGVRVQPLPTHMLSCSCVAHLRMCMARTACTHRGAVGALRTCACAWHAQRVRAQAPWHQGRAHAP
jgi:hypothetical protein